MSISKSFNIPLDEYLQSHLRSDQKRPITVKRAEILEILLDGLQIAHVQWEDSEFGTPLQQPILWWWKDWVSDVERVSNLHKRSERERAERFILEANVKLVAEHIEAEAFLSEEQARQLAFKWIKNKQLARIRAVGVEKLIERIEEL